MPTNPAAPAKKATAKRTAAAAVVAGSQADELERALARVAELEKLQAAQQSAEPAPGLEELADGQPRYEEPSEPPRFAVGDIVVHSYEPGYTAGQVVEEVAIVAGVEDDGRPRIVVLGAATGAMDPDSLRPFAD